MGEGWFQRHVEVAVITGCRRRHIDDSFGHSYALRMGLFLFSNAQERAGVGAFGEMSMNAQKYLSGSIRWRIFWAARARTDSANASAIRHARCPQARLSRAFVTSGAEEVPAGSARGHFRRFMPLIVIHRD